MEQSVRSFLDTMMREGSRLAQQGEDAAAQRLGVGSSPEERQRLRQQGMAGGAAAAGLAALLMRGAGGRRRGGFKNAIIAAGAGAIGKLALDAYTRRNPQGAGGAVGGAFDSMAQMAHDAKSKGGVVGALGTAFSEILGEKPSGELTDDAAEDRAKTLLYAMVAAAKADGHIDADEASAIEAELEGAPAAVRALIEQAMRDPLDPEALAARVTGGQEKREVYAASALLAGRDHPDEVAYLDRLARALGLQDDEARRIEDGLHA